MIAATTQLTWYLARSSGIVAWGLLVLSLLWGFALSSKVFRTFPTPAWILDFHRFLGATSLLFIGLHLLGLYMDKFVHFSPADMFVPLHAAWHSRSVAWGIVALYLLLAVELTSRVRDWLPQKLWRRVHYLATPCFLLATIHGLTAGTDRHNPVMRVTYAMGLFIAMSIGFVRWMLAPQHALARSQAREKRAAAREGAAAREHTRTAPAASDGDELEAYESPQGAPQPQQPPARQLPTRQIPGRELPAREAPTREAPSRQIPARQMPARGGGQREIPRREGPARELPSREVPGREVPGREVPGREVHGRELPGRELPAREPMGRDLPVRSNQPQQSPLRPRPGVPSLNGPAHNELDELEATLRPTVVPPSAWAPPTAPPPQPLTEGRAALLARVNRINGVRRNGNSQDDANEEFAN